MNGLRRARVASWSGRLAATAMILSQLVACGSPAPPKVDVARVKQFSGRGYLTDDRFSIARAVSHWNVGDYEFDIAWAIPVSGNKLPLVVYLPGLGESPTSGDNWRSAWAQAGYAVLSLQLLNQDQMVWSSGAARRGDFSMVARERYTREAVNARMKALAALLTELSKRSAGAEPLLQRLDLSRIAIAGFDVGAYTAMVAAGETLKGNPDRIGLPIPIAATVALSPYADFSGIAFSLRYQSVTGPVLSVSGSEDVDALGVVTSASVRKAPFEYMPSRDAYLLWFPDVPHAVISGSAPDASEPAADSGVGRRGETQSASPGGSRRDSRRSGNGRSGTTSDKPVTSGFSSREADGRTLSPTERALTTSVIQGISTAFLDAYLKQDSTAQEWLDKDARRWIGDRGELKSKSLPTGTSRVADPPF